MFNTMASSSIQPNPSNSSNLPTSTPKYLPPHRRHETASSFSSGHTPQPYLTYEDLHAKYSPPNSPSLRMPHVQKSLSAEDLYKRFHTNQQENSSENRHFQPPDAYARSQNLPEIPVPPPPLRDFKAFRPGLASPPFRQSSGPALRPVLTPRLPDPPIFNGSDKDGFENWRLRIEKKLFLNRDHYPTEAFQIEYVISRLGGKAIEHTVPRRREGNITPYLTAKDVLDQLEDLYQAPLDIRQWENRFICDGLRQRPDQPFLEFFAEFMKYASDRSTKASEKDLMSMLKYSLNNRLQDALVEANREHQANLLRMKEFLTDIDQCHRHHAERERRDKAGIFATQYLKARLEAESKPRGKYEIIPRPDPEEYRR